MLLKHAHLAWLAAATVSAIMEHRIKPCNPATDTRCLAVNTALGERILDTRYMLLFESDFHMESEDDDDDAVDEENDENVWDYSDETPYDNMTVRYNNDGTLKLDLVINQRFDNPVVVLNPYILYGKVLFKLKAAEGRGVISSAYLQSDDLDEIDVVEILGSSRTSFQTNYFVKGNTLNHERGTWHQNQLDDGFNLYSVEWTPKGIKWYVNNVLVRSVDRHENSDFVNKHGLPSSPMVLKLSIWAGGDDANSPGTIEWAGGQVDYSQAPFVMSVTDIRMEDYSNGLSYLYGYRGESEFVQLQSTGGAICGRMSEPVKLSWAQFIPGSANSVDDQQVLMAIPPITGRDLPRVQVKEYVSEFLLPSEWEQMSSEEDEYELGSIALMPSMLTVLVGVACVLFTSV